MLNDHWWFARIAPHPAPQGLRLQLRVVTLFYLLMYGIPAAADLFFSGGVYANTFSPPEMIFALSSSAALLALFWYLARAEGGSWRNFYNPKFLANAWCILLVPFVLALSQWGLDRVFESLQKSFPGLAHFCSPHAAVISPVPWLYFLPTTLAYAIAEEAVSRGYLITRVRQSGAGLECAVFLSTLVYSANHVGWGLNVFAAAVASGVVLALIYARWGGLAGFILGRMVWECSNYLKW